MGGAVALVALALWWFAHKQEEQKFSRVALPDGSTLSVLRNSLNYKLAGYLASESPDVPKTFHVDHLNFRASSTDLTKSSERSLSALATILKAYPNVQVQLDDHSGNPAGSNTNQKLSLDPANTVKAELVSEGVDPERISTTEFGWTRSMPAYLTEQGQAQNRWLDLTVTAK